jgi:hypothetical protein
MQLSKCGLVVFTSLLLFVACTKEIPFPNEVISLGKAFNEAGLRCPEKIWPDFSLRDTQIIFVRSKLQKAWVWNSLTSPEIIQSIEYSSVAEHAELMSAYGFTALNGRKTMGISIEALEANQSLQGVRRLFEYALHESFHEYDQRQKKWPPLKLGEDQRRGALYPEAWEPRLYRRMIFERLKTAFVSLELRNEFLAKAAFWQGKFNSLPGEVKRFKYLDLLEGPAKYVEIIGGIQAFNDCNTSSPQVRGELLSFFGNSDFYLPVDANLESYNLNLLAISLLSELSAINWQKRVEAGELPLDILLSSIVPAADEPETEVRNFIRSQVEALNRENGQFVKQAFQNLKSKAHLRISIPAEILEGAYLSTGLILPKTLPGNAIHGRMKGQFLRNSIDLNLDGNSAIEQDSNICGSRQIVIPIEADKVHFKNQIAEVNARTLKGHVKGTLKKPASGMGWFCGVPGGL